MYGVVFMINNVLFYFLDISNFYCCSATFVLDTEIILAIFTFVTGKNVIAGTRNFSSN